MWGLPKHQRRRAEGYQGVELELAPALPIPPLLAASTLSLTSMKLASPYRSLPADKRVKLVMHQLATDAEAREGFVKRIAARAGGFRVETVRKRPIAQLASEIVRFGMETPLDELRLLQLLYVELEPALQVAFLDAAGVTHERAQIPEELEPPFADASQVRSAALALVQGHGEDARRYLRTIALYNPEAWPGSFR